MSAAVTSTYVMLPPVTVTLYHVTTKWFAVSSHVYSARHRSKVMFNVASRQVTSFDAANNDGPGWYV